MQSPIGKLHAIIHVLEKFCSASAALSYGGLTALATSSDNSQLTVPSSASSAKLHLFYSNIMKNMPHVSDIL